MADPYTARVVSGEIMTDGLPKIGTPHLSTGDIVDADFVVLPRTDEKTEPVSELDDSPQTFGRRSRLEGMDMLRMGESPEPKLAATRGGPIFWCAGLALVFAVFWVSGGHVLMDNFRIAKDPQRALGITGVTSHVVASAGKPILFVDGEVANDGEDGTAVPPLTINVTGNDGRVTIYRLGTSGQTLAPGARFGFSGRLEVPKNGVTTVSVTFAS
jgi:hypothetical protein